jgi:hypothetical protein
LNEIIYPDGTLDMEVHKYISSVAVDAILGLVKKRNRPARIPAPSVEPVGEADQEPYEENLDENIPKEEL